MAPSPEEDIDTELEHITDTINNAARAAGADVSIHDTQVAAPADTPLTDPAARLLGDCVTAVAGSPARYELCAGCLDTRWCGAIAAMIRAVSCLSGLTVSETMVL